MATYATLLGAQEVRKVDVLGSAAFIKNQRRAGMSDMDIMQLMLQSDTKIDGVSVKVCPSGCTQELVSAAFAHANDSTWSKLPVTSGLLETQIERDKLIIANQQRTNTPKQVVTALRTMWAGLAGIGAANTEAYIAEAYRQIDLGYTYGRRPPNTYDALTAGEYAAGASKDANNKTTRPDVPLVQPVTQPPLVLPQPGPPIAPQPEPEPFKLTKLESELPAKQGRTFWAKHKWHIGIILIIVVGGYMIYRRRKY